MATEGVRGLYRSTTQYSSAGIEVVSEAPLPRRPDRTKPLPVNVKDNPQLAAQFRTATTQGRQIAGIDDETLNRRHELVEKEYQPAREYLDGLATHELTPEQRSELRRLNAEAQERLAKNEDYQALERQRGRYLQRMWSSNKGGIEIVPGEVGKLTVRPRKVHYLMYRNFSDDSHSPEEREFSRLLATCMAVITQDGYLILQRRNGNAMYDGMVGTSVGGLFDGKPEGYTPQGENDYTQLNRNNRGRIGPINTETILNNARFEANWEAGFDPADLADMKIVHVVEEEVQKHDEAIIVAHSSRTAADILATAKEKAQRESPEPGHEFAEKLFAIKADPATLEKLLTQTDCVLPATHVDAIISAGFIQIADSQDETAALEWVERVQEKTAENYERINQLVAAFWNNEQHREARKQAEANGIDVTRYDPRLRADKQGLPNDAVQTLKEQGFEVLQ